MRTYITYIHLSTCSTCTTLAICILSSRWSQILHILGIIIEKKGQLMTTVTLLDIITTVIESNLCLERCCDSSGANLVASAGTYVQDHVSCLSFHPLHLHPALSRGSKDAKVNPASGAALMRHSQTLQECSSSASKHQRKEPETKNEN